MSHPLNYAPAPAPVRLHFLALGSAAITLAILLLLPGQFMFYARFIAPAQAQGILVRLLAALSVLLILTAVPLLAHALPPASAKPRLGMIFCLTLAIVWFCFRTFLTVALYLPLNLATAFWNDVGALLQGLVYLLQFSLLLSAARFFKLAAARLDHKTFGILPALALLPSCLLYLLLFLYYSYLFLMILTRANLFPDLLSNKTLALIGLLNFLWLLLVWLLLTLTTALAIPRRT